MLITKLGDILMELPKNPGSVNGYLQNRPDKNLGGYYENLANYRLSIADLVGVSIEELHNMGSEEIQHQFQINNELLEGEAT